MENIKSLSEKVFDLETRVVALEVHLGGKEMDTAIPLAKKLSVKEFILSKRSSNDVQKTLAIAYYLEKNEGMLSFNTEDLARYFQLAKEPTPQNLNDKINLNIKKGHVMEAKAKKENKKAWAITNTGEQFVENNLKETK